MSDIATQQDLNCRPALVRIIRGCLTGALIGGVVVYQLIGHPVLQALVVLWAVLPFTEFRRRAVIRTTHIDARGRFSSRRIELSDVVQVGIGQNKRLWVQTRTPPRGSRSSVTYLRMIFPKSEDGMLTPAEVMPIIRSRAQAAGATLESPLGPEKHLPERDGPQWFSI